MLKIPSAATIRELDAYTIIHEPVSAEDLMERAAGRAAEYVLATFPQHNFTIVCGPGNNGGDGLVIGRWLHNAGKKIRVFLLDHNGTHSDEYMANYDKLKKFINPIELKSVNEFNPEENTIIIDCILGSGITRVAEGLYKEVIERINKSAASIISIDIPSGMFCDDYSGGTCVRASHTISFQFPKLAFLMPETGRSCGKVKIIDIGLSDQRTASDENRLFLIEENDVKSFYKKRDPFSHKGSYGHALIIAGSKGKSGAAILAASSCITSGAGMVTAVVPSCAETAMNAKVPEVMTITSGDNYIDKLPDTANWNYIGCGPGIGKDDATARALKLLIQNTSQPLVLDADALNILSENKTWLSFLPPGSILTPHPGELERLTGKWSHSFERLKIQTDFSVRYNCYIVLKDHFTSITSPSGKCFFNSTGNAGMSTAGSGDVLTGMILSLMAQGYSPLEAAIMGTWIHGSAGDLYAAENGMEAVTATGIISKIGKAFLLINA